MKKIKNIIMNFINGFCMALADSVPGVSGGTIAFLLGFYDEFISSLDDLFRGSLDKKKNALKFLIKIGIGWLIGFLSAATVLSTLFTTKIYAMSSLFIGFILFAIPIIIKEEITSVKDNYKNIIFTILGIILVVLITILTTNNSFNVDISKPNLFTYIYVFIAASIAITAMVLPGISGSTLLLVFGLYLPIMTSIKELLTFNFNKLPILIVFGLGVVIGIVFFVKLIRNCLSKHRSKMIYFIIGMMLGSIYSIIMGPTTLDNPVSPLSIKTFNILFFILGCIIIFGLELFKKYASKK
jgi:putative membrane protein